MGKTVFITGCSSGIGLATARLFAAEGWNVVATMRNPGPDTELHPLPNVMVTRLDFQDPLTVDGAVKAGLDHFGRVDVLVNNAGYGQFGLFEAIPRDKVREQFEVNVFGVMDVTRALLPHMRANQSGVIVNVSSGAGLFTLPMISLYCASKFALEGLSESLSYELASQNIIVKLVEPHGGVSGTRFDDRTVAGAPAHPALAGYRAFVEHTSEAFARMSAARAVEANEVARVIFGAATDGSDRLRYLVGNDSRGFVKARAELPDQEYVDFMRSFFR
jgi:NAD(P)-dependent dehydrogenase (short-subunit alcohol dehydrogenase family)